MITFRKSEVVFPAPAGVILAAAGTEPAWQGFPRTCGGDPSLDGSGVNAYKFSPHLRG